MSHLVPRQITDKNGVLTTRHVRADQKQNIVSSALTTCSPAVPSQLRKRLIPALNSLFDGDGRNEIKIASLGEQELINLNAITEHLENDADITVIWKLLNPTRTANDRYMEPEALPALSGDLRALATYNRMDQEKPLNETLSFVRGLWAYNTGQEQLSQEKAQALIDVSHTAMRTLSEMKNSFQWPDEDMNGELRSDLNMYYSFFGGDLEDERDGSLWIRNKKFVDMVMRRPEDAERISAMIEQRQTIQPDIIETMLDSDNHPSLLEGTL